MKKKIFVLFALLALTLSACSAEAAPTMYIQPAELTEEEEAVAKLLGADIDQYLFDVVLDGTAKKVRVNIYELEDGQWELVSGGGGMALKEGEKKGRLAFGFQDLRESFREAVQFGKDFVASSWTGAEELDDREGMSRATAFLSNRTEIVYEKEIPIAIQINTTKDQVYSYNPEYFFQPEKYAERNYEHVYALTVLFSQEPLS